MTTAIISFTEDGRIISEKIASQMPGCTRFCFHKHSDMKADSFTDLSSLINDIFGKYDAIIFIGSVGITVRAVGAHICSKVTDPAVVAVDDCCKFAVSVLSGHIGGANELAEKIAQITGATPVITTSTDMHNLFSPDVFAKKNGLIITDMNAAKAVAAAILNGEKVGMKCTYPHSDMPAELSKCDSGNIGICISANPNDKPFGTTLNLLPRNLIVGIGCKRGTEFSDIEAHVSRVLTDSLLDIRSLAVTATIDIKADEAGLLEFCERHGITLKTFTSDKLMRVSGEFTHSDFVEKTTGTDNVCERAAVCAGGRLIVPKKAHNGITAAISEYPIYIDFERKCV